MADTTFISGQEEDQYPSKTQLLSWRRLCQIWNDWDTVSGHPRGDWFDKDPRLAEIAETHDFRNRPFNAQMLAAANGLGYPLHPNLWYTASYPRLTADDLDFYFNYIEVDAGATLLDVILDVDGEYQLDSAFAIAERLIRGSGRTPPVPIVDYSSILRVCGYTESSRLIDIAIEAGNPPPCAGNFKWFEFNNGFALDKHLYRARLCVERFGVPLSADVWDSDRPSAFMGMCRDPKQNAAMRRFVMYLIDNGCPRPNDHLLSYFLELNSLARIWQNYANKSETKRIIEYLVDGPIEFDLEHLSDIVPPNYESEDSDDIW